MSRRTEALLIIIGGALLLFVDVFVLNAVDEISFIEEAIVFVQASLAAYLILSAYQEL
jgi:hypothetical protein